MPKRKTIQIQRVFYYQDLYMDEKGKTIMCRTIGEFILHDLEHKCKLDEVIEETLNRTPVPKSVERWIEKSRESPYKTNS